ncbi:isocitrate lyase/phosphoenolpyruvate mutase family protein [Paenarthrobacter sp. JL.01a]|nr:isocitrate lyase/phosphoenolpyruvate mutase family protein [Paenarthrobacter sp. JL.01a]UXM93752.1 isocitrate lyase/phosphoenolpyruvate mutase family protein [Paenarthrobacter sp. JL.01a]
MFAPGALARDVNEPLVEGLGHGKFSVIGAAGALPAADLQKHGVARVSYGPFTQQAALGALQNLAADLYASGVVPEDTPSRTRPKDPVPPHRRNRNTSRRRPLPHSRDRRLPQFPPTTDSSGRQPFTTGLAALRCDRATPYRTCSEC